jgi:hypothetical protein
VADISLAFSVDGGISLDDLVGIFTGSLDPSVIGEVAPIGSIYVRQNGQLFQKTGPLDTDWISFSQGLSEAIKISSSDSTPGFLTSKLLVSSFLTKTLGNSGGNETLTLDIASVGTPGTYTQVTTNGKGQVISGTNPTTLAGYGITNAQPLDGTLTALAAFVSTGIMVQTATDIFAARTITGTANQITVTNGSGTAGNPTLSFPSTTLTFPGTAGVILPRGTTAQRINTQAYSRFNTTTSRAEYYNGTTWISIDPATGGTVTSIALTVPSNGLSVTGSPITTSGTLNLSLTNDLAAVEGLSTFGIVSRIADDTWVTRSIAGVTDRIIISNSDAVAGNPIVDIASTYAGQSSITTLGLITSGQWHGTTIETQFGGTGRTTIGGANTILGVNTTASGLEYKTIVNGTGIGLGLTTQQIAISNTGVTSVIGTANQVNVSSATGAVTFSLPQSIGTLSNPTFNSVTVAANPSTALQLATKQYVDNAVQGLAIKQPVLAATTDNITLSGLQIVDGVSLLAGDRVLVKNQTTASQNGIYIVDTSTWTRAADLDVWTEVPNAFTFVEEGDVNADTGWVCTANQGGTLNTTSIPWVQFSSAGIVLAGIGLTKTGNTLSITNTGVIAGSGYNHFTVNSQGQLTAASTIPYITGNQTIVLGGDVSGSGTNAITTTLSLTGVNNGTYTSVTVDTKGRVTAGTNPSTLVGYGITDAQPLNAFLTAESNLSTDGFVIKNGITALTRAIVATSNKLVIVDGNGIAGNPSIDIVESNININDFAGPLTIAHGGTNLTAVGSPYQILAVNSAASGLEYKQVTGTNITITNTDSEINFATVNNGTVTSVSVLGSTGLSSTGSPITSNGTIQLTLDIELQGLTSQNSLGFITRTATGTYTNRSIVSGASTITVTNPQGISGNVGLDLAPVGTSGNYYRVTTDIFGRVVSGTNVIPWSVISLTPSTLAGYGITDAQPLNSILTGVVNSPYSGIMVKNGTSGIIRSIVATTPKIIITDGDGVAGNPSIDLGAVNLGDLANVVIPAAVTGDSLVFNGTNWINGSVTPRLYAEHHVGEVAPIATGINSIALGSASDAAADNSIAIGSQSLSRLAGITYANGRFAAQGDAQTGKYLLRTGTINGLPAEMFLDGTNGSERLMLASDMTWVWEATIVGHRVDSSDHAGFKLKGVIYCGASLNSITMLGQPSKEILARSNSSWDVSVYADTTHGSLKLTVTGATGQSIRWMAVVETTEVTN